VNYPDASYSRRFVPACGSFSFFDYRVDGANPELQPIGIDAVLVGLGGVGAAVVRTLAELDELLSGRLSLVDADRLSGDNLNRVTYARWQAALSESAKVHEAKRYLDARLPRLDVTPHQKTFEVYKRSVAARRRDRRYDVIVSGVDNDETRHELQRELPRVAIDAATGRDANLTAERTIIGQWGCLGCSRQMGPPENTEVACDELPDDRAPSISFVSGLAGTLAAGELIKEATHPEAALRGAFDHVFVYGLNPDLVRTPAFSPACRIKCSSKPVRDAYLAKYSAA
jgi:molybdopterin/thiamine biosynthesis adenylyltransferase